MDVSELPLMVIRKALRLRGILVGSRHTAESLWGAMGPGLEERTRLGPPGVDIQSFTPGPGDVRGLARALRAAEPDAAPAGSG